MLTEVCPQVVWTAGEKSLLLWCAFSGQYLGSIHHGDSEDYEPPPERSRKPGKEDGEREEKRHIDPKKVCMRACVRVYVCVCARVHKHRHQKGSC